MIKKGTWVQITKVVLESKERADNIPEDTKNTPLKMWVKGFCKKDCAIGEEVEIETLTGRCEKGIVTEVEPRYVHDFGDYIKEISNIGIQARRILKNQE